MLFEVTFITPLMSVTNAISSVIIVGAIIAGLSETRECVNTSSVFDSSYCTGNKYLCGFL